MYVCNIQLKNHYSKHNQPIPKVSVCRILSSHLFPKENSPMAQALLHVILLKSLPWDVFYFTSAKLALAGLGPWEHTEFG